MSTIALVRQSEDDGEDPYAAAFRAVGFAPVVVEPLVVAFHNLDLLRERLAHPEAWGGLVLTSPRAAAAVAQAGLPDGWRSRPTWSVGAATARRAAALGLWPAGAAAGTARGLADRIVAASKGKTRPLLFPCGERRRDDLPAALAAAGVPFETAEVYRAWPRQGPLLPPDVWPDWAAFFSPSGVSAALGDRAFPWRLRTSAIGPTTAEALARAGRAAVAVAAEPTPSALVHAVLAAS